ncbi:hypothetical protein A2U01_0091264, partial [Trifolium medium]|nr:hypothetical protein [Trifolium medium]
MPPSPKPLSKSSKTITRTILLQSWIQCTVLTALLWWIAPSSISFLVLNHKELRVVLKHGEVTRLKIFSGFRFP